MNKKITIEFLKNELEHTKIKLKENHDKVDELGKEKATQNSMDRLAYKMACVSCYTYIEALKEVLERLKNE